MDVKTLDFVTYCISKLSQVLNLSQREVYRRLKVSGDDRVIQTLDRYFEGEISENETLGLL